MAAAVAAGGEAEAERRRIAQVCSDATRRRCCPGEAECARAVRWWRICDAGEDGARRRRRGLADRSFLNFGKFE